MQDTMAQWLMFGGTRAAARARLFCFHHAGGAASMYRRWMDDLPPEFDLYALQLPGREFRIREEAFTQLEPLVQEVVQVLTPLMDRPLVLFGHSMGATVAFELARELRRRGVSQPLLLGVSGRIAPHFRSRFTPVQELTDAQLVEKLKNVGGLPDYVLNEPELMAHVLPLVRADYKIVDNYRLVPEPPLSCPIAAFHGLNDILTNQEEITGWQQHTTGKFTVQGFPGDHFFLANARREILQALRSGLQQVLGG
jgi:medium-chain acyl-[acyl-carrier-protein] hydrolase